MGVATDGAVGVLKSAGDCEVGVVCGCECWKARRESDVEGLGENGSERNGAARSTN
jgi:hypothetical protein